GGRHDRGRVTGQYRPRCAPHFREEPGGRPQAGPVKGGIRMFVAVTLGLATALFAEQPGPPVGRLIEDLRSADDHVRTRAAQKLAELGPQAGSAIRPLVRALRRERVDSVAYVMKCALVAMGSPAVPVLLEVLEDSSADADIRLLVLYGLRDLVKTAPD